MADGGLLLAPLLDGNASPASHSRVAQGPSGDGSASTRRGPGPGAVAWPGVATDLHYLIHGLVFASPVELPLPSVAARPADVTYRVSLGSELSQAATHSRADDPDDPWAIEHWIGNSFAIEFPDRATFQLSQEGVALVADETSDPDLVAHLLLDHVVPRLVALRGDLMLHAAGASARVEARISCSARQAPVRAPPSPASLSAGWELLDDDGIRVIEADDGPVALPGTEGIRLHRASAKVLLRSTTPGRPIAKGHPKWRFLPRAAVSGWPRLPQTLPASTSSN